jgi:hypothetical protein
MANNINAAKNKARVFDKICLKLGWPRGGCQGLKRRARWYSTGTPVVDANSHEAYPVKNADLALDVTNTYAWICTVQPATNTAATFVKLHA